MGNLDLVLLISRWIHISAAIIAVGGTVFMRFTLMPIAPRTLGSEQHQRLSEAVRARWARFVYACIALLLLSGALNFVMLAMLPRIDPLPYHPIFGVKVLAALVVFFLGGVLVGRSPGFASMRQNSDKWLTAVVALAGLIVLLSGMLGQVRTRGGAGNATITATSLER